MTRTAYRISVVRSANYTQARHALLALNQGRPALLYVGSGCLPRHVVMITRDERSGRLIRYDPALGEVAWVDAESANPWGLPLAGWSVPWAFIHPHAVGYVAAERRVRRMTQRPGSVAPEGA